MGIWHAEVPSPSVAAFIGFAAQVKYELRTLSLGFNPGDATGTQGIGD